MYWKTKQNITNINVAPFSFLLIITTLNLTYSFLSCFYTLTIKWVGLPRWLSGKQSPANAGDAGSIPELGRSPGVGNGNPLPHSHLENPMDRRAWPATVHEVAKETWLSTHTTTKWMFLNYIVFFQTIQIMYKLSHFSLALYNLCSLFKVAFWDFYILIYILLVYSL